MTCGTDFTNTSKEQFTDLEQVLFLSISHRRPPCIRRVSTHTLDKKQNTWLNNYNYHQIAHHNMAPLGNMCSICRFHRNEIFFWRCGHGAEPPINALADQISNEEDLEDTCIEFDYTRPCDACLSRGGVSQPWERTGDHLLGTSQLKDLWETRRIKYEQSCEGIQDFKIELLEDVPLDQIPDSQDTCPLCRGSLTAHDDSKCDSWTAKRLPCGHIMGYECLRPLVGYSGSLTCLYCRTRHVDIVPDYETWLSCKLKSALSDLAEACAPPPPDKLTWSLQMLGSGMIRILLPIFLIMILFTGSGLSLLLESDILPLKDKKKHHRRFLEWIIAQSCWIKTQFAMYLFLFQALEAGVQLMLFLLAAITYGVTGRRTFSDNLDLYPLALEWVLPHPRSPDYFLEIFGRNSQVFQQK